MSGFNMPPGVSPSDIPGNGPDDDDDGMDPYEVIVGAAKALLARIESMTTEEFSKGGERYERESLRAAIRLLEWERLISDAAEGDPGEQAEVEGTAYPAGQDPRNRLKEDE